MAKATKIEARTLAFNSAVERLKKEGVIESNKALAEVLGLGNVSTLSEIKAKRQNVQPDVWQKFVDYYKIPDSEKSVFSRSSTRKGVESSTDQSSIDQLLAIHRIYADAHKDLTDAHLKAMANNTVLTNLLDRQAATAYSTEQSQTDDQAKQLVVEKLIVQLGLKTGMWKSERAGIDTIDKLYAAEMGKRSDRDIHETDGVGTLNK